MRPHSLRTAAPSFDWVRLMVSSCGVDGREISALTSRLSTTAPPTAPTAPPTSPPSGPPSAVPTAAPAVRRRSVAMVIRGFDKAGAGPQRARRVAMCQGVQDGPRKARHHAPAPPGVHGDLAHSVARLGVDHAVGAAEGWLRVWRRDPGACGRSPRPPPRAPRAAPARGEGRPPRSGARPRWSHPSRAYRAGAPPGRGRKGPARRRARGRGNRTPRRTARPGGGRGVPM